jgi:hypothetical protein
MNPHDDGVSGLFLLLLMGAMAGAIYWSATRPERPPHTVRLPGGATVLCKHIDTYKESCAKIYGCVDGIERCVATYEVLP